MAAITALVSGCSKFEQINTDPDQTTKVTSAMLATGLIRQMAILENDNMKYFAYDDMMAHYLAWTESNCADQQFNYWGRTSFDPITNLNCIPKMIEYAPTDELKASYEALGHFVSAYTFFDMTLKVGDIPYSEALMATDDLFFPKYDTQKDVILGLLKELDQADALFAKGANFDGDYMYGGNCAKWRKAVNVMQLKILINLYKKTGESDLQVKERFNTIINSKPIFESIDDNLQIVYSSKGGQIYPLHKQVNSFPTYEVVTAVLIDLLKDYEDYRLFAYAAPTPNSVAAGVSPYEWDAYNGVEASLSEGDIIRTQLEGSVSGVNDRYENEMGCEPVFLLSYQEMNFILAEAAARGLISKPAAPYYEEGIRSSMKFTAKYTAEKYNAGRVMTDEYIENYIKSEKIALPSDIDGQIKQIISQKFITNFLQSPMTTVFENRRTRIPEMKLNPLSNLNIPNDKFPERFMYPASELSYNSANVNDAIQRQFGGTESFVSEMWILK